MGGDVPRYRSGSTRTGSSLAPAGSDLHERRPKSTRAAARQTTSTATDPVDAPCWPFWEAADQLTNTETRDRKRWSRSKFGQPAAIYTRAAVEYRGLCVQRRSDTPLRYAVVPDQNDGHTRREQQQCANKHHGGGVEGKWNDPNRPFSIRDRAPGEP